jgi:hypothetical protein
MFMLAVLNIFLKRLVTNLIDFWQDIIQYLNWKFFSNPSVLVILQIPLFEIFSNQVNITDNI